MIYNLSKEEQRKINEILKKFENKIIERHAAPSTIEGETALDYMRTLNIEFNNLIKRLEEERFKKLKTPTEIISNAKSVVEDAIIYEYAIGSYGLKDVTENRAILLSAENIQEVEEDFLGWDIRQKQFKLIKESQEPPKIRIIKSGMLAFLENVAIPKHIAALRGTPHEAELKTVVVNCLDNSKYIIDDKYIQKEPSLTLKRTKRTEAKAKKVGAITKGPEALIIPTMKNYQYSMSFCENDYAYLQQFDSMQNLQFKDGKLFFSDDETAELFKAELRDLRTKEGIEELDLMSLRFYYSILAEQFKKSDYKVLKDTVVVSASLLANRKNPGENEVKTILKKIQSYHNVMGVVKVPFNGKIGESYYQVLNFEYYDKEHNTISFSSPYMNYVIKQLYNLSVKKEEGRPALTRSGEQIILPTHSYLIDSSIVKERNKAAAENVVIIVTLIEQAGGKGVPNIKASTLIERNIQFAKRLEVSKNPNVLLSRTFNKTWELLKKKTKLEQVYKDIELPNPKDPAFLPTMKTLDEVVFKFPHKGKKS